MKKTLAWSIGVLVLTMASPPKAIAIAGNEYLSLGETTQLAYVTGLTDAALALSLGDKSRKDMIGNKKAGWFYDCVNGKMTNPQIKVVLDKYLREHSEKVTLPCYILYGHAMLDACRP